MGLIPAIIYGAGAILGAAVAKVIADDAKEWTPWVTRRLLAMAVRRLPGAQRERYAEEWAAHLAEVPGVVGKLAVSLQFQIAAFIAAFEARELDAKARLDAWLNERGAAITEIEAKTSKLLVSAKARGPIDYDSDMFEGYLKAIIDVDQRLTELKTSRPPNLGITWRAPPSQPTA